MKSLYLWLFIFAPVLKAARVRIAVAQYPQYHFKMILNCVYFLQLICTRNDSEKRPPRTLCLITTHSGSEKLFVN